MTYKELYLKEHPGICGPLLNVAALPCPKPLQGGKCPNGFRDLHDKQKCIDCWNSEIPEPKTLTKEDIRKLGLGLDPVIKDIEAKPEVEIGNKNAFGVSEEAVVKLGEAAVAMGWSIKDSGTRREFSTGAVRDIQEGKGRCDLMPLDVVAEFMTSLTQKEILGSIYAFQETGEDVFLKSCLYSFIEDHIFVKDSLLGKTATTLLEVAKHFEAGAAKYGEWNWQKGIPTHCYIDSAVRHYLKWLRGDKDEPHDRAFVWNILCCIWTCKHKPELNDYPRKEKVDV